MCVAAAIAGGSIAGGLLSSSAASSAAGSQENAANNATATQLQMSTNALNYQKSSTQPTRNAGNVATAQLLNALGLNANGTPNSGANVQALVSQLPGYQFSLGQGEKAITNAGAASGGALSSGTLTGLNNYAQNTAQGYYGQYTGNLATLAGLGENADVGSGNAVGNTTSNAENGIAQTETAYGNAAAAGTIGSTNAIVNGLANGLGSYGNSQQGSGTLSGIWNAATQNPGGYQNNSNLPGGNNQVFDNEGGVIQSMAAI